MTTSRPTGKNGSVCQIDSHFAKYMIEHINTIKLIWFVNEISNCCQIYDTICLTIKVDCNLSSGFIWFLLSLLAKMEYSQIESHID